MPELPEVETLKCYLDQNIINKKIIGLKLTRGNLRYELPKNLENSVQYATIERIWRRSKYLIISLDNGNAAVIHLGMTGRFTIRKAGYRLAMHDHLIFYLDDENMLVFNDSRRFGMIYVFDEQNLLQQKIFAHLGPEPFSLDYNADYLMAKFKNRKTPVKNALMDSKIVVGIGNIYASESLFLAKIHPAKPAGALSLKELDSIVSASKQVLSDAIAAGGTTLRDFVNGDNKPGYFQQKLLVYGRAGQLCYDCGGMIVKIVQVGRASFYCPDCVSLLK